MRAWTNLYSSAAFLLLGVHASCVAEQQTPGAIRVLNLSSQPITSFLISGLPFRMIGLDARPGEPLTPAFGDGQMSYEIYWRLRHGEMHGATVDLRRDLPASFDGNVVISIHDDHLAVSWSNVEPAWVEYSRVGDPKKVSQPSIPYYVGCAGAVLAHQLTLSAWRKAADSVRERTTDAGEAEMKIEDNRCNLDWYIPVAAQRERSVLDEDTATRLQKEWLAEVDTYRARGLNPRVITE